MASKTGGGEARFPTQLITGAFVDSSDETAIETQLTTLGVTGSEVIVIRVSSGAKVFLGKVATL